MIKRTNIKIGFIVALFAVAMVFAALTLPASIVMADDETGDGNLFEANGYSLQYTIDKDKNEVYINGYTGQPVDDAVKMVKEDLDVYSLNSDMIDWPLCCYMADATGNYGLLEIVNNEVIWLPKAPAQTNYYVNEKYQKIEDYKCGGSLFNLSV